jgi:ABC-type polysaccharide transport system, permease component
MPKGLKRGLRYLNKHKYMYMLLIPGLVMLIIFKYIPMYGVLMAFKNFSFSKGIMGSPWNHFAHFKALFGSDDFYRIFYNSVSLSFLKIVFTFPFPIVLALMLNEVRSMRFKRITQTIIYLPHFISWVVLISITIAMLSVSDGIVNEIVRHFTGKPISFLGDTRWFRPIVIVTSLWRDAGWNTIIYLAALAGIDPSYYEAAKIDGANRFKCIWHITLPGISSTIIVLLVLAVGRMMDNGFEQIFLLQNPLNMDISDVFETYTYRIGLIKGEFSYSAAVGLFKSVVGLILISSTNYISKKFSNESVF